MMRDERQQFRTLFRTFLTRTIDIELLSPGGEFKNLAIQFAAMLAAFNFVVGYVLMRRFFGSLLPRATLQVNAWADEELLISTTIVAVGLFAVLAWDNLLPDLRDRLVLGTLPIRTRTIVAAKLATIGSAVGGIVLVTNIFTSLWYTGIAASENSFSGILRSFVSYWVTMAGAAIVTFSFLISMQAIASLVLSYRVFLRVSGVIQLISFFSIVTLYFLKPPLATVTGLAAPQNWTWLSLMPSYWFLGLFQRLNGSTDPIFAELSVRAICSACLFSITAALALFLAYLHTNKRVVEQPDVTPVGKSGHVSRLIAWLTSIVVRRPIQRALLLFSFRTLARSRRHRLLLALYSGIGLAIAMVCIEDLLHGSGRKGWTQVNAPLMMASFLLLLFPILGTRIAFTFPQELRCNWVWRVTAVHRPADYFFGVRKSLYILAAFPVWIILAGFFFSVWPLRPALMHMLVLVITGITLVERSLFGFRKIPFACSYLPGKTNLKVMIVVYATLILLGATQGALLERWAMNYSAPYLILVSVLSVVAIRARRRFNRFAAAPLTPIQFEDRMPEQVLTIGLVGDQELNRGETFVDSEGGRTSAMFG